VQTCSQCRASNPDTAKTCYKCGGSPLRRYQKRYVALSHPEIMALTSQSLPTRRTGDTLVVTLLPIFALLLILFSFLLVPTPTIQHGGNQQVVVPRTPTPSNSTSIVVPPSPTPVVASTAMVTITPASQQVNNTFTITGVTGTPSGQQVQARVLQATTPTYSQTVKATGQGMTQGTSATGTVYISNLTSTTLILFYNLTYPCNGYDACSPLHIVLNQPVYLPAHQINQPVAAHIQEVGTVGNTVNNYNFMYESNSIVIQVAGSFTGGKDPQHYTYVQQSDIDNAANHLTSANRPDAQQVLQGQVQANERFIGTPQCTANTRANQQAGDRVAQVTVSVTFTCTGEVYDYTGALALAGQLLSNQAANNPGSAYVLTGRIITSLQSASLNSQTVSLMVAAKGVWVYQISIAQLQAWATSIAGQSLQAAQTLLTGQFGIAQVVIWATEANAQVLPTDSQKITVVVQTVPGL